MSLRDDILNAPSPKVEPIDIPEWGIKAYIRVMSGHERDMWDNRNGTSLDNARARYAVLVLCDEQGQRIFQDNDADALGFKDWRALDRIWDVGHAHNKQTKASLEAEIKNSEAAQSGNSSSSSAEPTASSLTNSSSN